MEQSPWETNRFSASQKIPHILWNPVFFLPLFSLALFLYVLCMCLVYKIRRQFRWKMWYFCEVTANNLRCTVSIALVSRLHKSTVTAAKIKVALSEKRLAEIMNDADSDTYLYPSLGSSVDFDKRKCSKSSFHYTTPHLLLVLSLTVQFTLQ
jgi:hypothetical protein